MSILFKKGVKKFQTGGGFSPLGARLKPFAKTNIGANFNNKIFKTANDMSGALVSNNPGKSVFLANLQINNKAGRTEIPVNKGGSYELGISSDRPFSLNDSSYLEGQHKVLFDSKDGKPIEMLFDPGKKANIFGVLHMSKK